jgi:hypothetical protein
MRSRQKTVFLSADHLDIQAASRTSEAALLPPGEARDHALKSAAQLRTYAAMKRALSPSPAALVQTAKC